jgi:hypothetical protein
LCWWMIPKGIDEPATRIVLGETASARSEKTG